MKNALILCTTLVLFASCSSIKTPSGEVDVFVPCQGKEYQSNKKFFRAFGSSVSNNPNGATQDAERLAAQELALSIESKVKVVSERYSSNIVDGMKGEFTSISEQIGRQVATLNITKINTICSKTTRDRATGMYKYYTAIEISVDDVINDFSELIEEESKENIRINRDAFRAIFDEEMGKN